MTDRSDDNGLGLAALAERLNAAVVKADADFDADTDRQYIAERLFRTVEETQDDIRRVADMLADCRERLARDIISLAGAADEPRVDRERRAHLRSKAEGVKIAFSKLDELIR